MIFIISSHPTNNINIDLFQSLPIMNSKPNIIKSIPNPQSSEHSIHSPQLKTNQKKIPFINYDRKRSKSQVVILQKEKENSQTSPNKKQSLFPQRQLFSKVRSIQTSIECKIPQRRKSQTVPQEKSIIRLKPITSPQKNEQLRNNTSQINKFPHYVTKSNQMVSMKQKLLQLKHRIKFNNDFPVLESIQNSVNVNRACFTRKMKVQVCKKDNASLLEHFQKDLFQYLQKDSAKKSKSQEKQFRTIDLPYLRAIQNKSNESPLDKNQKVHRMQEMKRKLKTVRKTTFLQRLK